MLSCVLTTGPSRYAFLLAFDAKILFISPRFNFKFLHFFNLNFKFLNSSGVVLSCVLTTGPSRYAFLLILDARTWEEKARASIDVKIGMGTHAMYMPNV